MRTRSPLSQPILSPPEHQWLSDQCRCRCGTEGAALAERSTKPR